LKYYNSEFYLTKVGQSSGIFFLGLFVCPVWYYADDSVPRLGGCSSDEILKSGLNHIVNQKKHIIIHKKYIGIR